VSLDLFRTPGEAYSHIAGEIDSVFIFITLVCLFFFVITQGALIYFAFKYRRNRIDPDAQTPYITDNKLLETIWIVIPSILILAIFAYGFLVFRDFRTAPAGAEEINVTAGQWYYNFRYPDGHTEVNQVRVPVNRPVKFIMTSKDVIHGFYLPDFRIKQDILPGAYTSIWVQPKKTGSFIILCTQYCGVGHSTMNAQMIVMNQADYDSWLKHEGKEKAGAVSLAEKGHEIMEQSGCLSCHTVDGTAKIGPTLKGLFGRNVALTDGKTVVADEDYIRESIYDPGAKIVKGFPPIMPTFKATMKDEDITAIIAYIKTLK
jgi:cytochrome c oxidase subunit II